MNQKNASRYRGSQSAPLRSPLLRLRMTKAPLNWTIFALTICLLVAWNYRSPVAFVNPFASPPIVIPFLKWGALDNDFGIYYRAGGVWLAHENPYGVSGFIYPPTVLPLFGLFVLLNSQVAGLFWVSFYLSAFLVASLSIMMTLKPERRIAFIAIVFPLLLTSYPFLNLVGAGQIDLLLSSLTIISLAAHRLHHPWISAAVLAAATSLKGSPILFLAYFVLFRRDWLYLARFAAATVGIIGLSLLVVPLSVVEYYLKHVLASSLTPFGTPANQSIQGVLAMMNLNGVASAVGAIGIVSFALFCLASGRTLSNAKEVRCDGVFLMNALIMLLFGPRSTVYPYVWVILPLAIFLCNMLVGGARTMYFVAVCTATFLLNAALWFSFVNYQTYQALPLPSALLGNLILGNIMLTITLVGLSPRSTRLTLLQGVEPNR
jgi:hypothetical protein